MGATPQEDGNNTNNNNNNTNNNEKQLRLRDTAEFSAAVDTLVVVDCTSNVARVKQVVKAFCRKEEREKETKDQIGLLQTCTPVNLTKSALGSDFSYVNDLADDLSATNATVSVLAPTLRCCRQLFELSKYRDNKKQVVIFSDGDFDDSVTAAAECRSLIKDFHATIKVITVGNQPNRVELGSYVSPRCLFTLQEYENTVRNSNHTREHELPQNLQMTAKLIFPHGKPLCLGEDVQLLVELENIGTQEISDGSRMANFVRIPKIGAYETKSFRVTLVTHIKGKGHSEQQLADLPEIIPFSFVDQNNLPIPSYYNGIYLDMQDFSGDIVLYKPLFGVDKINALLVGAIGAGKSSFVNSIISALGPSIDTSNYAGEEFSLMLHGIMPFDIDFCVEDGHVVTLDDIQDKRSSREEEKQRAPQVVIFFVPQGAVDDSEVLERLAKFLSAATITHRKKAVVVISHADEVTEEDRPETEKELCDKLAIDSKNVYWLENYTNKKKDFNLDKNIVRIVLAILRAADDQLTFENFNYKPSPYDVVEDPAEAGVEQSLDTILSALPQDLGDKLKTKMEAEQLTVDQLSSVTDDMWKFMEFSDAEISLLLQVLSS